MALHLRGRKIQLKYLLLKQSAGLYSSLLEDRGPECVAVDPVSCKAGAEPTCHSWVIIALF